MELIGKTTINPGLFYTGKFSGYITWIIFASILFGFNLFNIDIDTFYYKHYISILLLFVGLFFTITSLFNLGKSTRLGLPSNDTQMKMNGLYKFSRNPMYVGFNLITIASIVYTFHWAILILGIYSLLIYHLIILQEEHFMLERFGDEYSKYKNTVRRYL